MLRHSLAISLSLLVAAGRAAAQDRRPTSRDPAGIATVSATATGRVQARPTDAEIRAALRFDSVSLRRTRCYGACPVYEVVLRGDGTARYRGNGGAVPRPGAWRAELDVPTFSLLSRLVDRLDVLHMADSYGLPFIDAPSAVVTVWPRGGRAKTVTEYMNADSPELWGLISAIDATANQLRWTPAER